MPQNVVPLHAGDVSTLAKVLWGEARSEGTDGMEAVAWVVVNRVRQPGTRFPDTVTAVCRQPFQFSCFNTSDPNAKLCAAVNESDASYALALWVAASVLTGQVPDPTHGAQYYHTVGMKQYPAWASKMQLVVTLGHHRFYRQP